MDLRTMTARTMLVRRSIIARQKKMIAAVLVHPNHSNLRRCHATVAKAKAHPQVPGGPGVFDGAGLKITKKDVMMKSTTSVCTAIKRQGNAANTPTAPAVCTAGHSRHPQQRCNTCNLIRANDDGQAAKLPDDGHVDGGHVCP